MTYPTPRTLTTTLILLALRGPSIHASMARQRRTAATDFEFKVPARRAASEAPDTGVIGPTYAAK
jgi:hypothetical protein